MAIVLGAYTLGLLGVSLFVSMLTYATYQLLSSYLYKWREMKPIPEIEGTYPFIGNALQFKANAGDFFRQVIGYTEQFRDSPMLKIWIGPVPILLLFHAETIETVLNNPVHMDKAYAYKFLQPWLGTGLLTSPNTLTQKPSKNVTDSTNRAQRSNLRLGSTTDRHIRSQHTFNFRLNASSVRRLIRILVDCHRPD
ncbi:hypothetical protein J4Q44_G00043160 [Coregonus suidteri]|uniref:Uncharacterized protein n=1 Tax=Coregonus suidteri TaxID=861788 RepID=A0AAN8M8D3_9TELE